MVPRRLDMANFLEKRGHLVTACIRRRGYRRATRRILGAIWFRSGRAAKPIEIHSHCTRCGRLARLDGGSHSGRSDGLGPLLDETPSLKRILQVPPESNQMRWIENRAEVWVNA